ncbi:MAG TPA: DUF5597 domain-containing protein [Tepidisphaeraceae bacterium]|nr:DUF5597 domain-containing protein [Tepidisphaeraceae bacterium]
MKARQIIRTSILGSLVLVTACAQLKRSVQSIGTAPAAPHLQKHGTVAQLVVDGKPFLLLGGEVHNSSSSSVAYMKPVWPRLAKMHLNTVLVPVSWEQVEPREGQFDFSVVDGLLTDARRNDLRLVLLWMGSWKNSTSRYEADWVKTDQARFPRVIDRDGKPLEILSTFNENTRNADAKAFASLMRHVKEVDSHQRTVIMIQMQNEVGVLGDSRDHSSAANDAFAKPVPSELVDYLQKNKDTLLPEFRKVWDDAGSKVSGTWEDVFGKGTRTDEIFMAWNYARFMNAIVEAGKAEYSLPTFVNAWIVQPEDKGPGDYPSGGPQAQNHDLYRAGAPAIDILAPDIYLPDFPGILAMYSRSANPVLIPESRAGGGGAANAFFAVGQFGAIGYSPFGIDGLPDEEGPFPRAYSVLDQLSPLILEHQGKGTIGAVWLSQQKPSQKIVLGNYTVNIEPPRNRNAPINTSAPIGGYALVINTGPDEYVVAGSGVQITFYVKPPATGIVGLTKVEEGTFKNGQWLPGRRLNGDEVQLRYDLSAAAADGLSGSGLRFNANTGPTIQRVSLHVYK